MTDVRKTSWDLIVQEQMSAELTRKFITGSNTTVARIELKKGAVVPEHHHESEQISWIISGELLFEVGGKKVSVRDGEILIIPPNFPHKATAILDTVDIDIFSPVRDDWTTGNDSYLRS